MVLCDKRYNFLVCFFFLFAGVKFDFLSSNLTSERILSPDLWWVAGKEMGVLK